MSNGLDGELPIRYIVYLGVFFLYMTIVGIAVINTVEETSNDVDLQTTLSPEAGCPTK